MIEAVTLLKKHLVRKSNDQTRQSCEYISPERMKLAIKDGIVCLKDLSQLKPNFEQQYLLIFNESLYYCKAKSYSRSKVVKWKEIHTSDIVSLKICSETTLFLKANGKMNSIKILLRFSDQFERDEWAVAFNIAQSWNLVNDKVSKIGGNWETLSMELFLWNSFYGTLSMELFVSHTEKHHRYSLLHRKCKKATTKNCFRRHMHVSNTIRQSNSL